MWTAKKTSASLWMMVLSCVRDTETPTTSSFRVNNSIVHPKAAMHEHAKLWKHWPVWTAISSTAPKHTFCHLFAGEILTFHLARLLGLDNIPVVALTQVNSSTLQWQGRADDIAKASWQEGKLAALIQWVDGLDSERFVLCWAPNNTQKTCSKTVHTLGRVDAHPQYLYFIQCQPHFCTLTDLAFECHLWYWRPTRQGTLSPGSTHSSPTWLPTSCHRPCSGVIWSYWTTWLGTMTGKYIT